MSAPDFTLVFCPLWGAKAPWTAPAYLLEAVKGAGYRVQYLDYNIRLYWNSATPVLWRLSQQDFWKTADLEWFLDQIDLSEIAAPVVGFSLTETNIRFSVALARRLRGHDPSKTILFGGHGVFFPEDAEERIPLDACDAIVKGEGEVTLLGILGGGLHANPGTYSPVGGRWVFNGERRLIEDLDTLPWPRYEEVEWRHFPAREMSVMGSRGCINRCVFCDDIVRAGHRFRRRSADHIAEEMRFHRKVHDVRFTVFNDSIVNGDFRNLDALCDRLTRDGHDRPWVGNFAVRRNMPADLVRKVRRAGFTSAMIGLESGSSKVLSLMRKPFDADDAAWFITTLHEAGIGVSLNMIVGFPGETEEDFQETLRFLTRLAPRINQLVSVCPFMLNRSHCSSHLADFGVTPGDSAEKGHMGSIDWTSIDGENTWEVRYDRYQRLVAHALSLGMIGGASSRADTGQPARPIGVDEIERRRALFSSTVEASDRFRPLYVWDAGRVGQGTRHLIEHRGRPVAGFIDEDPELWHLIVDGLIVFPPSVLDGGDISRRPFVVIGAEARPRIAARLEGLGYREAADYATALDGIPGLLPAEISAPGTASSPST